MRAEWLQWLGLCLTSGGLLWLAGSNIVAQRRVDALERWRRTVEARLGLVSSAVRDARRQSAEAIRQAGQGETQHMTDAELEEATSRGRRSAPP